MDIDLEDFVIQDSQSQTEVKEEVKRARRKSPNLSQDAPKNVRIPIPESCKGYALPVNINKFITDIYPNVHCFLASHTPSGPHQVEIIHDTIQSFVIYMLAPAPSRKNVPHWTLYDPSYNHGKMPYYKYFLAELRWFLRGVKRDHFKRHQNHVSLSEGSFEGTLDKANKAFSLDSIHESEVFNLPQSNWRSSPTDDIFMHQVENFLFNVSKNANVGGGFEASAYLLFKLKMEESSAADIARTLKVTPAVVKEWMISLRGLLGSFFANDLPQRGEVAPSVILSDDFFVRAMSKAMKKIIKT